ncbi:phenylalanine--tRNA ligase subunit beta [Candidatus Saccharibacteria bacterium]|nr:phenylalanine--tRNA ligase subunit beta [Candidatus Saccharibacteria bacterium]
MRISLNWLKKFVKITVPDEELVRLIGARLVEVEGVIDETHKYDKIYVACVEKAEKIPDTHLTLCQINVGGVEVPKVEKNADGLVQVVCGAPNVREGMLAAWIAPGAVVPASVHEDAPFVIDKRKMLGKYESNGMLAGADELDFGDDHSGIVEIDPETAEPGQTLADVFELDDLILDIENKSLTHRPDCFGVIGFAREVAGILGEEFAYNNERDRVTKVHGLSQKASSKSSIKIENERADICSRYTAMMLTKHGELKHKYLTWQDTILSKSGMRPVEPVVDATNYLMLLTGQPLHAFDYDKFVAVGGGKEPRIVVRLARRGEKLVLLDGKEVELTADDIVICSGDTPVALAGAMGGESTACDENTRNIILEAATFSLYNLRKTQMAHGIFSEAITRFTKGQPAYQTLSVAEDFAALVADGFRVTGVVDKYPHSEVESVVEVTTREINGLLGTDYSDDLIVKTLTNVGFLVKHKGGLLKVTAPVWRTDIHIKEDVIEEVGRLNGYDNIVPTLPRHATAVPDKMLGLKACVREIMKEFGANEVLTYSFVSEKLLKKAGVDAKNSYKIVNSISPELQYVRQTIVPSLLDKAYMNQKLPVDEFAMWEVNKVYRKNWGMDAEGVPAERMQMGCAIAERKGTGTAYYKAKFYVAKLLEELGIMAEFLPIQSASEADEAEARPFEPKRTARIVANGECIGVVGEFKNSVRRNFKLAEYLAGFELDVDVALKLVQPVSRVRPFEVKDRQDITVTTTEDYARVYQRVCAEHPGATVSPVGIYQPEGAETKNITFHLEFY